MSLILDEMRAIGSMDAEVIVVGIEPCSPDEAFSLEQAEEAKAVRARTEAFFEQYLTAKGDV
jgi:hypothetical protein